MKKGLLFQKRVRKTRSIGSSADPDRARYILMVSGAALALIGWMDAVLLWYPLGFGDPEWEFATTSGFVDAIPLGTLGILALAAGAVAQGARKILVALSVIFPLIAVAVMASGVLFALNAVIAWKSVDPAYHVVLQRAVLKTSVLGVVYVALYLWLGWTVRKSGTTR